MLLIVAMAVCIIALGIVLGLRMKRDNSPTKPPLVTEDDDDSERSETGEYRFATVAADAQVCSQIGTLVLTDISK